MTIHCPYCQLAIELKGAHPGRFSPKCTGCHGQFLLMIPEGENAAPIVKPIPGREPNAASIEDALGLAPAAPAKQAVSSGATAVAQQTGAPPRHQTNAGPPASAGGRSLPAEAGRPGNASSNVVATIAPQAAPAPVNHTQAPLPAPSGGVTNEMPIEEIHLSGSLGGYEVHEKLGQGGMGAVFLARQVSLDRNVALKVLAPRLASDPQFISRFTREAYAAAQLSHHNVVQIHDIGIDRDMNFFSMEFVEGKNLAGVVRENGKVDPEVAAGYILQAARGLKFAHDHGMIHRDVKPENLLLSDEGIVKVADLGLVKREGMGDTKLTKSPVENASAAPAAASGQTQLNISMGTPAYMPPEQAVDAAHVDLRADVYALGCTFYDLLVGRPPFAGKTVYEVITKHAIEPVTPPDRLDKHIPPLLSAIVMRMMAKRKEDRYQNMGQVIAAIEEFLGIDSGKPFTPKDEHVKVLEFGVERFNQSIWAKLRQWMIRLFALGTLAAAVICALPAVGHPLIAGGLIGFGVLTMLIYQITIGLTQKTAVFSKFRQLVFGASIVDWLKFLAVIVAGVGILYAFNLHWVWLGFGVLAAGVAIGFHFSIDLLAGKERSVPVMQVEGMLKQMRLRGLEENALRNFVCRYAGDRWEEFYEALFGYEAKMDARRLWGKTDRGRDRRKHAAWRDAFIAWVDHKLRARKEAKERKLLAKLEAKALHAKGIEMTLANKQAQKNAERLVHKASVMKKTAHRSAVTAIPGTELKPAAMGEFEPLIKTDFLHDDSDHEEHKHESYLKRRYGGPLDIAFGRQVRFTLAALILAGFAMWWNVNGGWETKKQLVDMGGRSVDPTDIASQKNITVAKQQVKEIVLGSKTKNVPLRLKMVPDKLCDMAGSWNGGLAGLLLLATLFAAGKLVGATVILGAFIAMAAHRYNIPLIHGQAWLAALIGTGVVVFAAVFLRERKGF